MYPLSETPYPKIDAFLQELHSYPNIKVVTNVMSTQLFGEASAVFAALQKAITQVYQSEQQCPFVLKVLHGDVSGMTIKDYRS